MKPLDIRFSETQQIQVSDLSDVIGTTKSDIARAALALGMAQIKELAARKIESAQELVAINAFKAKQ